MRRDVDSAQIGHMIGRVIGLVFAHRDAAAGFLGFGLEHHLRSAALGSPVGERDHARHRQPMPILHGSVAHIAELRLPPSGLAVKTAVGIAGARMRVVLALLFVEIGPAIFIAAAVLGAKALVRGPRLDQRSVHRKMLVRQQRLDLRMVQKLGHEFGKHLAVLQSLAVLREGGRVPDRVVGRKPHKPPVQEIVVQLLHQLAFRPDAVEHLEQQRAQQLFRRNRGTAFARVELPQATVQFAQYIAHKLPDLPQRMVRRHPRLGRDVRKQPTLIHKCAPHAGPRRFVIEKLNHDTLAMARVFQQTARGRMEATAAFSCLETFWIRTSAGACGQGRYFWNKRTGDGLKKAIDYFSLAIEKDPNYAEAYTGLADSYALSGDWEYAILSPRDASPKAKAAATKALALDDSLGEAHTSLAFALDLYDWDWASADKEYQRAIALNPGYATAHHWYAWHLIVMRRNSEGIFELRKAESLDPLSLIMSADLADALCIAHLYDESVQQSRKTLEMEIGRASCR